MQRKPHEVGAIEGNRTMEERASGPFLGRREAWPIKMGEKESGEEEERARLSEDDHAENLIPRVPP